jgi:hypothetical protein
MMVPGMTAETKRHAMSGSRTRGRWLKIIAAMLVSRTDIEAAAHAGISIRTLYRLKKDAEFQADLQAARDAQLQSAVNSLRGNANLFVDTLTAIAGNEKEHGNARVRAAEVGMNALARFIELEDIVRRLQRLEAVADGGRN